MPRRKRPSVPVVVTCAAVLVTVGAIGAYAYSARNPVLPGLRGCAGMRDTLAQSKCISRELEDVVQQAPDVEAGLAAVDEEARARKLVASHCHLAMHRVGERAGRAAARGGETPPPSNGSSPCRRGFMHGMMLSYVTEAGRGDIARVLPALCERDGQDERNCAHVAGHLLARGAGSGTGTGEVAREREIDAGCVRSELVRMVGTHDDPQNVDVDECVRGGYMEIAIVEEQPSLADWRAKCTKAPARTRRGCFGWLPPLAAYHLQEQDRAAAQCERFPVGSELRRDCVLGVSTGLTGASPCDAFRAARDRTTCRSREPEHSA